MNKHNWYALLFAALAAGWSQLLIEVGQGTVPIPDEYMWLFRVLAAVVSMALSGLTPYFKLDKPSD